VSGLLIFILMIVLPLTVKGVRHWREVRREEERERRRGRARSRRLASRLRDGEHPFDLRRFLARVERAFLVTQQGLARHDLDPARPFLSDGVHECFALEIEERRARGCAPAPVEARVEHLELLEVRTSDAFEVAAVQVDARVDGARDRGRVSEVWSFLRRAGARPAGPDGLLEGRCPNCGAPLAAGDALAALRCASCGIGLRGALRDWVLTTITQRSQWKPRDQRPPPGLRRLRERDPGFTLEHLEDRAAVLFRRDLDAARRGNVAVLVPVAAPACVERRRREIEQGHGWLGACSVGLVRTRGVVESDELVRALVEIGFEAERQVPGLQELPFLEGLPQPRSRYRRLYILARRRDARSDPAQCLLSAHCLRCGAPVERSGRIDCRWCGEVLNDGHGDWILQAVLDGDSQSARSLLAALPHATRTDLAALSGTTRGGLLAWAASLALADGRFKPEENAALLGLAERLDVPVSDLRSLAVAAQRGEIEAALPGSDEQARAWLRILHDLACADGALAPEERALLDSLARRCGLDPRELEAGAA
jgi:tellurite resistance protein